MGLSKRAKKLIFIPLGFIVFLCLLWTGIALIGRVATYWVIPSNADLRLTVQNPHQLINGIMSHESLDEISSVPEMAMLQSAMDFLHDNELLENFFIRSALSGELELALLFNDEQDVTLIAAMDMGFLSPALRILPHLTGFFSIPDLYYVQAGENSRFEYRLDDITLYIGHYRNLLFITNSSREFANRLNYSGEGGRERAYSIIDPSSYDAAFKIAPGFFSNLLASGGEEMAAAMMYLNIESPVEAGLLVYPQKLEFYLATALSSEQRELQRLLEQRERVANISELFPASSQYATVLSAGTLNELLGAAMVFSGPDLGEAIRQADSMSRTVLRMPLEELLFSWSGNEFAVFGMEGRPHPVYAIQIADERKRQEIFDRAFRSIALSENVRLNLDGTRIPQIEVPSFIQSLLRIWNISLPSPYYIIHNDYLYISESAENLLTAQRAMQRNEVLPRTAEWRELSGAGVSSASAFSLYYSLDISVPFFLRESTGINNFLRVYRQGLLRLSLDRGQLGLFLSLVPGPGRGIMLVNSTPINTRVRPSNVIYGEASGDDRRIYLVAGETVLSYNPADGSIFELQGQGQHWIIPAGGISGDGENLLYSWIVSDRGRVTLVDENLEALSPFPIVTGLRISAPPVAYNGRLYLSCEDGRVHAVDMRGGINMWETSFFTALRSPPAFFRNYAAAYPKGFFGEIWLLDLEGRAHTDWPASLINEREGADFFSFDSGLGFGSPLLFAHNNRVMLAFVSQAGDFFVFDEYAANVRPFPMVLDGVFYLQPVFDGEYFWLISAEGNLFRVDMGGEVLLHNIDSFSAMEEGFITLFDHDGDGVAEIFFTGEGNALHGYTRHFRSLESFPLPMWGRPYFYSGDRRSEIFGMGMDGNLYRYQFR